MTLDLELQNATRCLLGFHALGVPRVDSVACWSDGDALWFAAPVRGSVVAGLRTAPRCAVGAAGVVARGTARVFMPDDVVGWLVHGPVVTAAMAAYALRHPRALIQGWPLVPVRVGIDEVSATEKPIPPPGIAPGLPEAVPADIRRELSGLRQVLVATDGPDGIHLAPATWGAGFVLDARAGPGEHVAVAVTAGDVAVVLTGTVDSRGALIPAHASWWRGQDPGSTPLSPPPRGAVQLPD